MEKQGGESEEKIYMVEIEKIRIPDVRVTSRFDPEVEAEFLESVKTHGVLEPVSLALVEEKSENQESKEEYVLIDGLHRVLACRHLGITHIPARIRKMRLEDVLIQNVITARQRGKENPAETAKVVKTLIDEMRMSIAEVQRYLALSDTYIRRLYKVASLPAQILEYVEQGKISVSAAYHIANLERIEDMLSVAQDAANWGYTEQQVRARVIQLLNPDVNMTEQEYSFTPAGEPQRILPKCVICEEEIAGIGKYVWMHEECHARFMRMMKEEAP
jgi:ParB family chromosome partitioning protein